MPALLIFSITAVIASLFVFCASAAVRARLSAPITTQARSGACLTTPSPLVTMTGGPGGCETCAAAGTAASASTTANDSALFTASLLHGTRYPEPDGVRISVGRHLVAMAAR